ncbi:hypothetical protein [Streptomyces sp. KL116D]|uniref:hypothetical protein n=1 Tax=Streptomyces sp. KL116D TaxID=3045152 RepID=UPI00355716AD
MAVPVPRCCVGGDATAGSDWPVSSPDPIQGIHVAVNRVLDDAPDGTPVFLPEQRIGLADAPSPRTRRAART